MLELSAGSRRKTISLWNPNIGYAKGDIVLYTKVENKQISPDVDKRQFIFILSSIKDNNTSTPNYDMVDGVPNFTKTNWQLINPMSYLMQDLIGMKSIVKDVFQSIIDNHVKNEHGLIGGN